MLIEVLKSKLHCVTVTEANLNYMGSITIDEDLLDAADMIAGQKVQIVDNNNGERFETYIIKAYALMDFEEAKTFQPKVVFPENNKVLRS